MSNDPQDPEKEYTPIPLPSNTPSKPVTRKIGDVPVDATVEPKPLPPVADTSIPLNPVATSPDQEVAITRNPPKRDGFIRRFKKKHPFVFFSGMTLFVLGVAGAIGAVIFLSDYHEKAAEFDLDRVASLEVGSLVLDRKGREIGRISMQDRLLVRLDQLPVHLVDALIATEDNRFYTHNGFDVRGIFRAAIQNMKAGGITQGGSTITQQLARHAFALEGRTIDRKLTEVFLANRIERAYTKNEIIESYFNRIYLGSGFWGIGAAARGYFGKNVEDLTLIESATICALIKSPSRFSPFRHPEASIEARNRTLHRMKELGMLTEERYAALEKEPNAALSTDDRLDRPHFLLTQIRMEALKYLSDRETLQDLIIKTSVDLDLQEHAIAVVNRSLKLIESREGYKHPVPWSDLNSNLKTDTSKSSPYLQAAIVAIENDTGRILTALGGRNFRESQFNRAWQSNRQTGSAFLPFLYAAAYEEGQVSPATTLIDAPFDNRRIMIGGEEGVLGEWATESEEDSFEGNISAAYALAKSKNSPTARMALDHMSTAKVSQFANKLGLEGEYADYPSIYLGTTPSNLLKVVKAYSAIPNGGQIPKNLSLISSIENRNGTKFYTAPRPVRNTVFSERTAAQIHKSLLATFTVGTGKVWRPESERLKGQLAGKSGTSYKFEDNWFIGYNAEFTWGVWLGFDLPKTIYPDAFGSDTALPIWLEIAEKLDTSRPDPFVTTGYPEHDICLKTGCKANENCPSVKMPFSEERWKIFRKEAPLCDEHSTPNFRLTKNQTSSGESENKLRARPLGSKIVPKVLPVIGEDPYQSLNPKQIISIE